MIRQSYRETLVDVFLYMLPVYLPFYQALLIHGVGQAILFLLLALLFMFLVAHKADVCRSLAFCLKALSSSWVAPARLIGFRELSFGFLAVPNEPNPSALFQRPPPLIA
jgi:hypothetical protein